MPFDINSIEDETLRAGLQQHIEEQIKAKEQEVSQSTATKFQKDIEALQGNNQKLVNEKSEEEKRRKALEAMFGDRDPQAVSEMLKKFEEDEDSALLQSGKFDEFKAKVAERERTAGQALVEAEAQARTLAEKQAENYKKQIHDLTIGTNIRSAFVASGGVTDEKAQEYAAIEASRWWSINGDGQKECRDPATGELVKGKAGLMTEQEWVQEKFRPTAPFMFEGVSGSGASGSEGGSSKPFSELSLEEQSKRVDEVGLDAAMAG